MVDDLLFNVDVDIDVSYTQLITPPLAIEFALEADLTHWEQAGLIPSHFTCRTMVSDVHTVQEGSVIICQKRKKNQYSLSCVDKHCRRLLLVT